MIELVTGFAGKSHIDADDIAAYNRGTLGAGSYVLETGDQLSCSMQDSNTALIGTGDLVMQGRHVHCATATTLTVQSGTQSQKRNDLIVCRYAKASNGVESATLTVLKGTPTTGSPADPAYNTGVISDGASVSDMPLWRIPLDGISVGTPIRLAKQLPTLASVGDSLTRMPVVMGRRQSGMTSKLGAFVVTYDDQGRPPDIVQVSNGPYTGGYEGYGLDYDLLLWGAPTSSQFQVRVARGGSWAGSVPVFLTWLAVWL